MLRPEILSIKVASVKVTAWMDHKAMFATCQATTARKKAMKIFQSNDLEDNYDLEANVISLS